jgi:hypothetical protein
MGSWTASSLPSFTDVEYGNRRRVSRREQFLETMDATIPWTTWVGLIEPHYYSDRHFAFTKTRYRGIAKNVHHLQMLFASANWLMRARAVAETQATA